ncbi:hypothetical protein AB0A71_17550 [Kitasatospora aureofaciens]|uniref:hypothetical protein n=1 Tax=Kitasatospora aureofaciens TaxID=1894 RepID=UPI003402C26F
MERFARVFGEYDAVVTSSASCAGGMVRENHPVLAEEHGGARLRVDVAELAPRVHEFTDNASVIT